MTTAVTRYESDTGWYDATNAEPAAALRPHVLAYGGREERSVRPVARLEVPYPDVIASISFGPELRVGAASHRSFVAEIHETAARTEHDGHVVGVQFALTPLAAHAFFRTPMHALASRTVELDDILGVEAERLAARLHEIPSWSGRFRELDAFLGVRIERAAPRPTEVTWAWRQLRRTAGHYPIGRLADELGWSRKQLATQFREQVGTAPKSYARLLRFHHAVTLLRAGERRWRDLALDCGYADQPHFNRDFRQFAGVTPTEFAGRLSPDDPGVAGA
jgi:AraC-like DNA-binding protein